MALIQVTGLRKQYQDFVAVSGLTLDVPQGEIFGFLGPNGAGKTTTIRMLTGLLVPTAGEGQVGGVDIRRRQAVKRVVGLMPESQGYYSHLTPVEYLRYFGRLYEVPESELKGRVSALVETVGLRDAQARPVGQFSRGMRQRLGLARTIIHNPRVILLDEPSLGLDPQGQRDMQNLIRDLNRASGVTVFLCSHQLSEVSQLCRRVAIVSRGSLLAVGDELELARQLVKQPTVTLQVSDSVRAEEVCRLTGITVCERADGSLTVSLAPEQSALNDLVQRLTAADIAIYGAVPRVMNLEEVFLELVGTQAGKQVSA
jgi:ABC-2 type transport system ATP-binding protein